MATPRFLTLRFDRQRDPTSARVSELGHETYIRQLDSGDNDDASLHWDDELRAWLAAISQGNPDPGARNLVGQRLVGFLRDSGWDPEAQIPLEGDRLVITVCSSAAELYSLPWELLPVGQSGACLGDLAHVHLRYEWPGTHTKKLSGGRPAPRGRVLLVHSSAGGPVSPAKHIEALRRAGLEHWDMAFDPKADVIAGVQLDQLRQKLTTAAQAGRPYTVLQILAHGCEVRSRFGGGAGLWFNSTDPTEEGQRVTAEAISKQIGQNAAHLRFVWLAVCRGGDGAGQEVAGSVGQEMHRHGVRAVLASRARICSASAEVISQTLWRQLLDPAGPASLEDSVAGLRATLRVGECPADGDALQIYARRADGADTRPFELNPFRGLRPFGVGDAALFFGRGEQIKGVLRRLERLRQEGRPPVMIVEAESGAGKSSFLRAGIGASCAAQGWAVEVVEPSRGKVGAVHQAVARLRGSTTQHRLLLIDPLDELFTHMEHLAEREAFVGAVHAALTDGPPVHVVAALATEFKTRCHQVPLPGGGMLEDLFRVRDGQADTVFYLPTPTREELGAAIEGPAQAVGLRISKALVRQISGDALAGTSALPLLQSGLEHLWQRRVNGELTDDAYQEMDGIVGALGNRADAELVGLSEREIRLAKGILVRLVALDGSLRRVPVRDLVRPRVVDLAQGPDRESPGSLLREGIQASAALARLTSQTLWKDARRVAMYLGDSTGISRHVAMFALGVSGEGEEIEAPVSDAERRDVYQRLCAARLVVERGEGEQAEAMLAHTALYASWRSLQQWVREGGAISVDLARVDRWLKQYREEGVLLLPAQLGLAEEFKRRHPFDFPADAYELIDLSTQQLVGWERFKWLAFLATVVVVLGTGVMGFGLVMAWEQGREKDQLNLDQELTNLALQRSGDPNQLRSILRLVEAPDEAAGWHKLAFSALAQRPAQSAWETAIGESGNEWDPGVVSDQGLCWPDSGVIQPKVGDVSVRASQAWVEQAPSEGEGPSRLWSRRSVATGLFDWNPATATGGVCPERITSIRAIEGGVLAAGGGGQVRQVKGEEQCAFVLPGWPDGTGGFHTVEAVDLLPMAHQYPTVGWVGCDAHPARPPALDGLALCDGQYVAHVAEPATDRNYLMRIEPKTGQCYWHPVTARTDPRVPPKYGRAGVSMLIPVARPGTMDSSPLADDMNQPADYLEVLAQATYVPMSAQANNLRAGATAVRELAIEQRAKRSSMGASVQPTASRGAVVDPGADEAPIFDPKEGLRPEFRLAADLQEREQQIADALKPWWGREHWGSTDPSCQRADSRHTLAEAGLGAMLGGLEERLGVAERSVNFWSLADLLVPAMAGGMEDAADCLDPRPLPAAIKLLSQHVARLRLRVGDIDQPALLTPSWPSDWFVAYDLQASTQHAITATFGGELAWWSLPATDSVTAAGAWDARLTPIRRQSLGELVANQGWVRDVRVLPGDQAALVWASDGSQWVSWAPNPAGENKALRALDVPLELAPDGACADYVCLHPDGRLVARLSARPGEIVIEDLLTGRVLERLVGPRGRVSRVRWTEAGKKLEAEDAAGWSRRWDVTDLALSGLGQEPMQAVTFMEDGAQALALRNGQLLHYTHGGSGWVPLAGHSQWTPGPGAEGGGVRDIDRLLLNPATMELWGRVPIEEGAAFAWMSTALPFDPDPRAHPIGVLLHRSQGGGPMLLVDALRFGGDEGYPAPVATAWSRNAGVVALPDGEVLFVRKARVAEGDEGAVKAVRREWDRVRPVGRAKGGPVRSVDVSPRGNVVVITRDGEDGLRAELWRPKDGLEVGRLGSPGHEVLAASLVPGEDPGDTETEDAAVSARFVCTVGHVHDWFLTPPELQSRMWEDEAWCPLGQRDQELVDILGDDAAALCARSGG